MGSQSVGRAFGRDKEVVGTGVRERCSGSQSHIDLLTSFPMPYLLRFSCRYSLIPSVIVIQMTTLLVYFTKLSERQQLCFTCIHRWQETLQVCHIQITIIYLCGIARDLYRYP